MKNQVAKRLRKAALQEMIGDGVPKRELVWGTSSVINSPQSIRAMYLRMKQAWKRAGSLTSTAKHPVARTRKCSDHRAEPSGQGPALIQSPLKHIEAKYPPVMQPNGVAELHCVHAAAVFAASRGNGGMVKRLARDCI